MLAWSVNAQNLPPDRRLSAETNRKLESFLNSTRTMKERKVAVSTATARCSAKRRTTSPTKPLLRFRPCKNYEGKKDENSKTKWAVCRQLIDGDNVTFSSSKITSGSMPE